MDLARLWRAALHAAPLRVWAIVLAGPALCVAAAALIVIIWRGNWPESLAGNRLDYLGWALLVVLINVTIIIAALAAVRVKASSAAGQFEVGGDTNERPPEQRRRRSDMHPQSPYYGERE